MIAFYLLLCRSEQQAQNLAFCLSMLSYSERGLRKLQENMSCYQSVLTDPDVYSSFVTIIGKLKKFPKPEVKVGKLLFSFSIIVFTGMYRLLLKSLSSS